MECQNYKRWIKSSNINKTFLLKAKNLKYIISNVTGLDSIDTIQAKKYGIKLNEKYLLIALHPVTEEYKNLNNQVESLMSSLSTFDYKFIWICPNNDAGSFIIKDKLLKNRKTNNHVFENLSRKDFLYFLKNCECIIGNSSAGLLEAPSYKKPAINIGRRQHMRIRGINVIDCPF